MNYVFNTITEALHEWSKQHSIVERSIEACLFYLEAYRSEEPDEFTEVFPDFDRAFFTAHVESLTCGMSWPEGAFSYIAAEIPVQYKQEIMGQYRAYFLLSGEFSDDTFSFRPDITRQLLESRKEDEKLSRGDIQ